MKNPEWVEEIIIKHNVQQIAVKSVDHINCRCIPHNDLLYRDVEEYEKAQDSLRSALDAFKKAKEDALMSLYEIKIVKKVCDFILTTIKKVVK